MSAEIKVLQSNLTLEEIHTKEAKLSNDVGHLKNLLHLSLLVKFIPDLICYMIFQVKEMEKKLINLREGVTLVSPEERKAVERVYTEVLNQWRRRKRMFKDIWDAITENSPKDVKEFKVVYLVIFCVLHKQTWYFCFISVF